MAGFREFVTGEVLTAGNVNDYLMQQSVMKFADASARDTALGTAVGGGNALREGMVAYLDDTDEVLAYDGTAWGSLGLPLGTATPTDGQILAFGTATSTWNPTDQLAGIGSNVVQSVLTSTFSRTSTSFGTVTGLTATITPSSASSKVLVLAQYTLANTDGINWGATSRLARDGTAIYQADAASNRIRASYGWVVVNTAETMPVTLVYLDSPATTSATTYAVQVATGQGRTVVVNRSGSDSDLTYVSRSVSSITAIEVAA